MRRSISLAAVFALLVLGMLGCSEETPSVTQSGGPEVTLPVAQFVIAPCGVVQDTTLYAGQYIDAGSVAVYNNDESLCIEITTAPGWEMTESHVAMASQVDSIPQTGSGNPKVGQFDLAAVHDPPVTTYVYTVVNPGYTPAYIAVHAVVQLVENGQVVQQETAWAAGEPFPGANWATYITYDVQACGEPIVGACCYGESCVLVTQAECESTGGTYLGDDIYCDESPCTLGACSLPDGTCVLMRQEDCEDLEHGGTFMGDGTVCGGGE